MTKRFGPHGFYDEAKLTRLMEVLERNIEADIATEAPLLDAVTLQPKPRPPKPDRTLEQTLLAELTNAERKELDRLARPRLASVGGQATIGERTFGEGFDDDR